MLREAVLYSVSMAVVVLALNILLTELGFITNTVVSVIYWSHALVGTLSLGITILYYVRYRQTRIRAILYIFLSKLSFLTLYIVQAVAISMINSGGDFDNVAKWLFYTGIFLGGLGPALFVVFVSSYVYEQARVKELIIPLLYIGMLFSYIINDQLFGTVIRGGYVFFEYKASVIWLNTVGLGMYVFVGWYTIYRIRQTRNRLRDPWMRIQQRLFMVGTAIVYMASPFVFALVSLLPTSAHQFYWISVFAPTFIVAGISVTAVPYIFSTKAAFLQPQPLHQLIVIREGGNPVLSYSFDSPMSQSLKVNDLLFSSAVSAVSSLMDEAISQPLTSINFENKTALTRFDDDLAYVVIVDFVTNVLRTAIHQFALQFSQYYYQHPEMHKTMITNPVNQPDVVKMIMDNFGY